MNTSIHHYARVLKKRSMGKVVFADSLVGLDRIQLVFKADTMVDFGITASVDKGDLLKIEATEGVTNSGERSLFVTSILEVIKNESGLVGMETRFQEARFKNRHVDIALCDNTRRFWRAYTSVLASLRRTLGGYEFNEFNTGVLQKVRDGGLASAFTTSCKATGDTYALSLTSELKLKRLIAGGFGRVYEIAESFRNEGVNKSHMPEFTLLECYAQEWTAEDMASFTEELVLDSFAQVSEDSKPDYSAPFARLPFVEAWKSIVGTEEVSLEALCKAFPLLFKGGMPEFTWIYKTIYKLMAPQFMAPTFIVDIPKGFSPFAKVGDLDARFMEGGVFVANGLHIGTFSRDENDWRKVSKSLKEQNALSGVEVNEEFVSMLRFGMPPTAGLGLGINRLMMLLLGELPEDVRETALYPLF